MSKILRVNRRHFLMGAGGFTLAMPFLGSLERGANAGNPPFVKNPRFVAMATPHGGVWNQNMWPDEAAAAQSRQAYPGHDMHWGQLAPNVANGQTELSKCLSAPSTLLPASLVSKINLLRGLDYSFYLGHHRGGHLGNIANNDDESPRFDRVPTIDQVMAWSPSFYPDIANIKLRSMHVERGYGGLSSGYANPSDPQSSVEQIPAVDSAHQLFDQIFVAPEEEQDPRPLIVDKVYDHYRRLRHGTFGDATRLSTRDKSLIDAHMERLLELQRKLQVTANCGDVTRPTDEAHKWDTLDTIESAAKWFQTYNDVVVAAFVCGTSRIAIYGSADDIWYRDDPEPTWTDWHQQIAHIGGGGIPNNDAYGQMMRPAWQEIVYSTHQEFFKNVFLDLCAKLDVEESEGVTYLDNTLIQWTMESGNRTHDNVSMPVITAGSAAGYFNTGRYIDFRNRQNTLFSGQEPATDNYRPGVLYNQWLANVLLSMNVTPAEFERNGKKGYGEYEVFDLWSGNDPYALWPDHLRAGASNPLPELVKGV